MFIYLWHQHKLNTPTLDHVDVHVQGIINWQIGNIDWNVHLLAAPGQAEYTHFGLYMFMYRVPSTDRTGNVNSTLICSWHQYKLNTPTADPVPAILSPQRISNREILLAQTSWWISIQTRSMSGREFLSDMSYYLIYKGRLSWNFIKKGAKQMISPDNILPSYIHLEA